MGVSAAMTPKERKQILAGLIEQGAVVVRDGNHGTILNLKQGKRFTVPVGTSDHKARLAMRSQVRRLGYQWPLDPPTKQKEEPTMSAPETVITDERGDQQIVPPYVTQLGDTKPREATWRAFEPYAVDFADREFWTDELTAKLRHLPGYRNPGAAIRQTSYLLWFGGFRVRESKPNRNGRSYKWYRPEGVDWPTEFAADPAIYLRPARPTAVPVEEVVGAAPETPTLSLVPSADAAPSGDAPAADDVELSLALEQEQRANRAERLAETRALGLETEKRAHAQTRRDLLIRIANWEKEVDNSRTEITRLRSLLEERDHLIAEQGPAGDDSILRRAKAAEDDVRDLTTRLQNTEVLLDETSSALMIEQSRNQSAGTEGWWPLEASAGQTLEQLIAGAPLFGLEVRVEARRKS